MEICTLQYTSNEGWSQKAFPKIDSENTLIMIFASSEFKDNPAPIKELSKNYPQSKMIGCSSAGEITGAMINDNSLSVVIVRFDKTQLKIIKSEIKTSSDSCKAGETLSQQLAAPDLAGIFVLSDGLNVNGSELVKGLNSIKNKDVVITGGLAGDGDRFKQTWIICNGEILENTIVAVGFYGASIQIGHASRGGWDSFGPERRITKSENNILFEFDQKPALDLYKEYLGERASELPAAGLLFPLAIRKDKNDERRLVRTILGVDDKKKTMTFAGDVPAGYLAQLMRANFDRLITSAGEAGEDAISKVLKINKDQTRPILSVAISCVGRRILLGERTEEEIDSVLSAMPSNIEQVGFYSYGELSPYSKGECDLHNQTMTLTTFYEA